MPHTDNALNQHSHAGGREIRLSPHVVARELGDSTVLVHLQTNRIYELNTTGSRIWKLIESGESGSEIVRLLSADFAVSAEVAERDLNALVADLERGGLLETAP